ncbi:pentapeptide repeat-containing protein [Halospeciosus flavus]|uniref:Pentapeptide repeat-containing protein n=2 Tax=Halospeciosus flavus TaxID=3032283 RepID=A0ABD5Z252_9EURY|nr:hypothetical protein [Halospeciosus flavus]
MDRIKTAGNCQYRFEPGESELVSEDASLERDEPWECPHDAVEGEEYCVFHLSTAHRSELGIRDRQVRAELIAAVESDSDTRNEFVGATFGELDLRDRKINSTNALPINFRHCTFEGKVRLQDAHVVDQLDFSHSYFRSRFELDSARFDSDLICYDCAFDGVMSASTARFSGRGVFSRAGFEHTAAFNNGTTFDDDAIFTGTTFRSNAKFTGTQFEGRAFFRGSEFRYRALFTSASFADIASFADARFTDATVFDSVRFDGPATFGTEDIHSAYGPATFETAPTFEDSVAEGFLDFTGVDFEDGGDFSQARFEELVDFRDSLLMGDLRLDDAQCGERFEFNPRAAGEGVLVSCERTSLDGGTLAQPTKGHILFDFRDAVVGSISVQAETSEQSPIDYMRFVTTAFREFDFTSFRPALEPDYEIHNFGVETSVEPADLDPREEELTYTKAKSGADMIGDNRAESGFFVREMRARGDRHAVRRRNSDSTKERIVAGVKEVFNRSFDVVCEYTENPHRLLAVMLGIIGLFAGIYWVLYSLAGLSAPYPEAPGPFSYILLSGESFTGLHHPPAAALPTWPIRLVGVAEAVVGALLIALFLFTLTRAVHR